MAFPIAVSGLRSATADLDVTANNLANANTTGFKNSRAGFADIYAVSNLESGQHAIGQGVHLTSIVQQFNQGNISFTDNNLDLAINGEGFFVLDDGGTQTYSRAGAFGVDKDGFVSNATGQTLIGFQASGGSVIGALSPMQLSAGNIPPSASAKITAGVNLDAGATAPTTAFSATDATSFNNSTSLTVFDSLGEEHLAAVYFRKTSANTWDSHLVVDGDTGQTTTVSTLSFNSAGQLTTGMPVSFGSFTPATGAAAFPISIDLTGSTQFGANFGVNALSQDGFTTGRLSGIDIDEKGVVLARFTNGQSQIQGQVALANFANPQGLQSVGDSSWAETNGSGAPLIGSPGSASLGLVQSSALEESNVDLAAELVSMIVAQRNFQANAQMIRTEDEIIQTIVNIR